MTPPRWSIASLGLVVCTVPVCDAAPPSKEERTLAEGEVGERIVDWVRSTERAGFSGVVFAAREGEPLAAVGVGSADLEGEVPNTPATLFEIASATKQFTAAAVLRLVDEGKLDLDASIAAYLPGVPRACRGITVRHLLQHTSGIPGTNSTGGGADLARVLPSFLAGGPRHEPGTRWEYWNQGYALSSEIIARAAKEPYVAYSRRALFLPAKMTSTCFTGDPAPRGATVAVGRSTHGEPRSALEHPYGSYGFHYRGMGGAVTTVWDLWRWDRALDGELLSPRSKRALFEPGLSDYALGWFVKTERGRLVQSHAGSVRGFICELRRYPEHDGCVFVLCNDDDAPLAQVVQGVEELLFGQPVTVRFPRHVDAELARELAGTYTDARGNELKVELQDRVLRASIQWTGGQVSSMSIGYDDAGELVAFQGSSAYGLVLGERAGGEVPWLSLDGQRFTRRP